MAKWPNAVGLHNRAIEAQSNKDYTKDSTDILLNVTVMPSIS